MAYEGYKTHLKTKHGLACGASVSLFHHGGLAHYAVKTAEGVTCKKCLAALKRFKKNHYNWITDKRE